MKRLIFIFICASCLFAENYCNISYVKDYEDAEQKAKLCIDQKYKNEEQILIKTAQLLEINRLAILNQTPPSNPSVSLSRFVPGGDMMYAASDISKQIEFMNEVTNQQQAIQQWRMQIELELKKMSLK